MRCETCTHYDEHPFIREDDRKDYCKLTNEATDPYGYCNRYKEAISYG